MQACSKMRHFWALAAVLLAAAPIKTASAQPMARRLPADTVVYAGWNATPAFQQTAAVKMLSDRRLMQPVLSLVQRSMLAMPDDIGQGKISQHLPELLTSLAQSRGCFAQFKISHGRKETSTQAVLMIELGDNRKAFEEHLAPIHARIKQRLGDTLTMAKIEGSWMWNKTVKGQIRYTWGFVGDTFIFYIGDRAAQMIPRLMRDETPGSLASSPAFRECMDQLPGDAVAAVYFNPAAALEAARGGIAGCSQQQVQGVASHWQQSLASLGLDNVRCVAQKTTLEDGAFIMRTLLRTDGRPHGLIATLSGTAVDDEMLNCIPEDAMWATAMRVGAFKAYEQIKAAAIAGADDDARALFERIETPLKSAGLTPRDALEPLGEQWVMYNATSTGSLPVAGLTLIGKVRDADRANSSMNVLWKLLAGSASAEPAPAIQSMDVDGVRVHYVAGSDWLSFASPAWAIAGDNLIISLSPQAVEDAIAQIRGGRGLGDSETFAAARQGLGRGGSMFYLSMPQAIRGVYPLACVAGSMLFGAGESGESTGSVQGYGLPAVMPSMQRLLRYSGTDLVSVQSLDNGILCGRYSENPLMSPLSLIDAAMIWGAMGAPDPAQE